MWTQKLEIDGACLIGLLIASWNLSKFMVVELTAKFACSWCRHLEIFLDKSIISLRIIELKSDQEIMNCNLLKNEVSIMNCETLESMNVNW